MLIKSKDGRLEDIQELNRLLSLNITAKQRFLIERELKCLVSGERNEQNSAYYLDFSYKDSLNWALAVSSDSKAQHDTRKFPQSSYFPNTHTTADTGTL